MMHNVSEKQLLSELNRAAGSEPREAAPLRASRRWGTPQPERGAMTLIDRMQELLEAERAG